MFSNNAGLQSDLMNRNVSRQKMINLFGVDENRTEQCFAAHIVQCFLAQCFQQIEQHCQPESARTQV
jgi:hypothetical protein